MNNKITFSRGQLFLIHVAAWVLYFNETIMWYTKTPDWDYQDILLSISEISIYIGIFYLFFSFIWPLCFKPGKYWLIIPGVILGFSAFIFARYLVEEVAFEIFFGFSNYRDDLSFWFYINDNYWRPLQLSLFSGVIYLLVERVKRERRNNALEQAKQEAELSLLRSQINPHFLFNMLGYLHTEAYLIDKNLANSIVQFSDLLRYSNEKSISEVSTVKEEINHLETYLDLMKKRFGENCFVEYQCTGQKTLQKIEPMLLMPFAENAFKHGIYNDPENPIVIKIKLEDNTLFFLCKNKINSHQKDEGSGIGVNNVKHRLNLIYPNQHELKITESDSIFEVNLKLEC